MGPGVELFGFLAAVLFGLVLSAVDLACLRLPDPLVGALLLAVVGALSAAAAITGDPGRLGRAGLAGLLCLALHTLLVLAGPLGAGDAKLAGVLGLLLGWLGWPAVWLGLALPHLLAGPWAAYLLLTRRADRASPVPFGPALLGGSLLAAVVAG